MFKSRTTGDQGADDPERIAVTYDEDPMTGHVWMVVEWFGDDYEDAWFAINEEDLDTLEDNT